MEKRKFHIVYILPSRYDDEGYVHRYVWGVLPSNTLFCLRSLTLNAVHRGALGEDVDVTVEVYDDSVHKIRVDRIVRQTRRAGATLLVGFVGVQSNQFPRAGDIAVQFREHDVPVLIGGFHVSGVLALMDKPDPEMERLLARGVTMVAGEVEEPGILDGILRDAWENRLQPMYRVAATPSIVEAPVPAPEPAYLKRFIGKMGTIDTSRGCPFNCSFCTIINVQGRKMRHRSAECMLRSIEEHYRMGIIFYFFTDDNFSRSPIWGELFDGLTQLREAGKDIQFMMQVDTQAWKIPGFIERAAKAGCFLTFIGMETINEDNLKASSKRQNKVRQYAEMVQAWHDANILVHVGYIIGFPHDTVESVRRNLVTLRDHIKVDEASFFMLTPLPGSRDHKEMVDQSVPIDADLNNLDSFHETFRHPNIPPGQWRELYVEAWDGFYSKENMTNVLLRVPAERYWRMFLLAVWNRYADLHRTHTMITGFLRRKDRMARRPIFGRESLPRYAWRRARDIAREARILGQILLEYQEIWLLTRKKLDPRFSTLAYLRDRWSEVRQGLRNPGAAQALSTSKDELVHLLADMEHRLLELGRDTQRLGRRAKTRLTAIAEEVALFRVLLADEPDGAAKVLEGERFIDETLSAYEEAAIGQVSRCRRLNAYIQRLWQRAEAGRPPDLRAWVTMPRAIWDEAMLGSRFLLAFMLATKNRLHELES